MEEHYRQRFSGIGRLYGDKNLETFSRSSATVIGIGGVGSWCAEALLRSGLKQITLIDLDEVCITNTNRQLHALSNTVGKTKVSVLAQRLELINPDAKVVAIEDFLTESNLSELITKDSGVIVDAIDSLKNKALLAKHCFDHGFPLVTVGGAGGKKDPTLIRTGDLSESTQDNLLKRLKKKLRVDFGFPRQGPMNISCVYSLERAVYPTDEGGTCFKKDLKDKSQAKLDCATGMGTATFATGAFGFAAAHCALNYLTQES